MNDEWMITLFFIKICLSLFFEKGRERDRRRRETTEGFGHCYIDPYLLLSRVVLYLALLKHTELNIQSPTKHFFCFSSVVGRTQPEVPLWAAAPVGRPALPDKLNLFWLQD